MVFREEFCAAKLKANFDTAIYILNDNDSHQTVGELLYSSTLTVIFENACSFGIGTSADYFLKRGFLKKKSCKKWENKKNLNPISPYRPKHESRSMQRALK